MLHILEISSTTTTLIHTTSIVHILSTYASSTTLPLIHMLLIPILDVFKMYTQLIISGSIHSFGISPIFSCIEMLHINLYNGIVNIDAVNISQTTNTSMYMNIIIFNISFHIIFHSANTYIEIKTRFKHQHYPLFFFPSPLPYNV